MSKELTLNEVRVDWWTLTSWSDAWYQVAVEFCKSVSEGWERRQRMQYNGVQYENELGTAFVGEGLQDGKLHYILQIDGELAHASRYAVLSWYPAYMVKCTRVDIQITTHQPNDWSQWDFLVRMRNKYGEGLVGYPRPNSREGVLLQTVYVGRREGSDRFMRLYVKLTDDCEKLIRLETEIKRDRAQAIYDQMARNQWDEDMRAVMHSEIKVQSQKDRLLDAMFYPYIEGHHRPVKVRTSESNTSKWIVETCIPSIDRHLHEHGADRQSEIESMILKIAEFIVWRKYEK